MATFNSHTYAAQIVTNGRLADKPAPRLFGGEVRMAQAFIDRDLADGDVVRFFRLPVGATIILMAWQGSLTSTASLSIDIGDDGDADRYVDGDSWATQAARGEVQVPLVEKVGGTGIIQVTTHGNFPADFEMQLTVFYADTPE